jgi:hypothetical protein
VEPGAAHRPRGFPDAGSWCQTVFSGRGLSLRDKSGAAQRVYATPSMQCDSLALGTKTVPSRKRPGGAGAGPPRWTQFREQPPRLPAGHGWTEAQLVLAGQLTVVDSTGLPANPGKLAPPVNGRPSAERSRVSASPQPSLERGVSHNMSRTEQISPPPGTPQGSQNARQHWHRTSQGKLRNRRSGVRISPGALRRAA